MHVEPQTRMGGAVVLAAAAVVWGGRAIQVSQSFRSAVSQAPSARVRLQDAIMHRSACSGPGVRAGA